MLQRRPCCTLKPEPGRGKRKATSLVFPGHSPSLLARLTTSPLRPRLPHWGYRLSKWNHPQNWTPHRIQSIEDLNIIHRGFSRIPLKVPIVFCRNKVTMTSCHGNMSIWPTARLPWHITMTSIFSNLQVGYHWNQRKILISMVPFTWKCHNRLIITSPDRPIWNRNLRNDCFLFTKPFLEMGPKCHDW